MKREVITIKGEEYEECSQKEWGEAESGLRLDDDKINYRYFRKVKKVEPKFPKVFENKSLKIEVLDYVIEIEDKVNKDLKEIALVRLGRNYKDWDLVKEAIKYAEDNQ